jgi:spore germination protein GerM
MTSLKTILSALLVVLLTVLIVVFNKPEGQNNQDKNNTLQVESHNDQSGYQEIHLYFADRKHLFLRAEKRRLASLSDPAEAGENILKMLIQGPSQGLMRTIPEGTKISAFYVTDDATAYVDLSEEVRDNQPGGAITELLTIYSIVNSLILNVPEIKRVKILICGRESMTLAGHISLRPHFKADMLLIR